MSYTVILVEDEKIVRDELAATIGWERLDLKLIGTAGDGIEGESLIKKLEPDIVITDIRLPGIDGLEMLSHCPINHAIILSGHTDFNYMKKAIRLGVFDYLLKPVDDQELENSLSNLVARIHEEDSDYERLRKCKNVSDAELIPLPHTVNNHVVDNAIGFIASNFNKPIGLQEAATFLGLSESHLSRLFKEVTGLNFLQYLNAWRINKSVEMMKDPKRNIGDIATNCGFPTPGYFAKIFKRFSGTTPTQYRDDHSSL
ncbi:MAG: helix-turn-helix domain-containing protein [Sphaerochaetaceae bacterium]